MPHRQATGMPCMLPEGVIDGGVEVGVRVEPQHAQLAAGARGSGGPPR
jgi:hypothetical protein